MIQKKRVSVALLIEVYDDLAEIADSRGDSVDKTAASLIQQAIKELKRKRKDAKKDNI